MLRGAVRWDDEGIAKASTANEQDWLARMAAASA